MKNRITGSDLELFQNNAKLDSVKWWTVLSRGRRTFEGESNADGELCLFESLESFEIAHSRQRISTRIPFHRNQGAAYSLQVSGNCGNFRLSSLGNIWRGSCFHLGETRARTYPIACSIYPSKDPEGCGEFPARCYYHSRCVSFAGSALSSWKMQSDFHVTRRRRKARTRNRCDSLPSRRLNLFSRETFGLMTYNSLFGIRLPDASRGNFSAWLVILAHQLPHAGISKRRISRYLRFDTRNFYGEFSH